MVSHAANQIVAHHPSSKLWAGHDACPTFCWPSTYTLGPISSSAGRGADAQQAPAVTGALGVSHLDDKPGRNAGDGALRRPEAGEEAAR